MSVPLTRDGGGPLMVLAAVAAGWLVATFVAVTMHGYWWPGRQLVVILPLAVLVILWWLARCGPLVRRIALGLGLVGVVSYAILLIDGYQREITWVSGFQRVDDPLYALIRHGLPDYRGDFWPLHIAWIAVFAALLVAGFHWAGRHRGHRGGAACLGVGTTGGCGTLDTTEGSS